MSGNLIKLLPIDKPGFLQAVTRRVLLDDYEIRILAGMHYDTFSMDMVQQLQPDIITIAIETNHDDVVPIIQQIMASLPLPILLHSEVDLKIDINILEILQKGAVDYFTWPSFQDSISLEKSYNMFLEKIHFWGRRQLPNFHKNIFNDIVALQTTDIQTVSLPHKSDHHDLVVIGGAMGGGIALSNILKEIEDICCPIVVALQTAASITKSMVKQLRRVTNCNINEAINGIILSSDSITFIPDGVDGVIKKNSLGDFVFYSTFQPGQTIHPSVNRLFISAATQAVNPVAIVLSGQGNDGTEGAAAFSKKGFSVLVQDPDSCLVNEMSTAVIGSLARPKILSILEMVKYIKTIKNFN